MRDAKTREALGIIAWIHHHSTWPVAFVSPNTNENRVGLWGAGLRHRACKPPVSGRNDFDGWRSGGVPARPAACVV